MNKIKLDKTKTKVTFNENKLTKEQFENICKLFYFNKKTLTKSVKKVKTLIDIEKKIKIQNKAKENGFYYLNSFLLVFKEKIIISQSTFYNRFNNKNVIQYLINNNYIYAYKSNSYVGKDLEKKDKIHFIVDYNRAEEFAELIYNNLLAMSEKSVVIEKRKRKYNKK